ncbi:hypothetical protein [Janthinobacterium lividum]|uniref:hypothetical protein n=1 Tax=Janthinobacterium lividum TaxID=29581 RepID=UPI001409F1F3|nr:hypothetical protein [Janthinobacterium lividum]
MGIEWLGNSVDSPSMLAPGNLKGRWVYLMLGTTALSNPLVTARHPNGKLKLTAAPGVVDHLEATLELLASCDHCNIKIHDKHKKTHGISDIFDHTAIDRIEDIRRFAEKSKTKNSGTQKNIKKEKKK